MRKRYQHAMIMKEGDWSKLSELCMFEKTNIFRKLQNSTNSSPLRILSLSSYIARERAQQSGLVRAGYGNADCTVPKRIIKRVQLSL